MKSLITAVTVALCIGCFSGCEDRKQEPGKTTEKTTGIEKFTPAGTNWVLDLASLKGAEADWEKPRQDITLGFDEEGKVYGSGGVNRYFAAPVTTGEDGSIKFGPAGATLMAGPGMQYEALYFKTLTETDNARINNGKLELRKGDEALAVFTPAPKDEKAE